MNGEDRKKKQNANQRVPEGFERSIASQGTKYNAGSMEDCVLKMLYLYYLSSVVFNFFLSHRMGWEWGVS